MASSAIYRYFGSRDELLTTLIIDGYDAVGAAVEAAESACPREDHPGRWLAACQALRAWALAHPHEYALVYGSPVPGYQAPQQTIEPASRVAAVLGKIISDACSGGAGTAGGDALAAAGEFPAVPGWFTADADRLRESVLPGVPDDLAARSLSAWAGVFGLVSFELFGQFNNVVTDRDEFFRHGVSSLGHLVGLPA
jgi:AcrR family transcriptional regulator